MNMETRENAPVDKSKTIAFRVLLSRRDLNWDQEKLAEASGISRGYISKLERGYTTNPGVEIIFALAKALGISVEYLLGLTDDPLARIKDEEESIHSQENSITYTATNQHQLHLAQRFIAIFATLSARDQELLLRIAETMRSADTPRIIGTEDDEP